MSENTKTLHQAASTLKKNPGRVERLVKSAAMRIVPAGRYASGSAKKLAEQAIAKLKAPKGFGGADLATKSSKFFKEASDKSKEVAMAAGTAASAGLVSAGVANDRAKALVNSHNGRKNFSSMKKGSPIEKNLEASAKRARRMAPAIRKATRRAGVVGTLAGAALGASAAMKKEAAEFKPDRFKTDRFKAKKFNSGHEFVSAAKKPKMGKKLALAAGAVAAGAAAAGVVHKSMKKEASIASEGTRLGRAAKAFAENRKRIENAKAWKQTGKAALGSAATIAAATAVNHKNEKMKKQASELVIKDGKKYRKGTIDSATGKMTAAGAALAALRGKRRGDFVRSTVNAGVAGIHYGIVRGANRIRKGEISVNGKEMKELTKKAAELIERNGKKYRKGNTISAAATMAGINAGMDVSAKMSALSKLRAAGEHAPHRLALSTLPHSLIGGALMGAAYGGIRNHFRKKRGEISTSHADFKKLKAGK